MPNIDLTRRMAQLSALDFSETELIKMNNDMSDIIALMDKIREFDADCSGELRTEADYNNLRADEPCISPAKIDSKHFFVPKTV